MTPTLQLLRDSDPVFAREARESGRVLARRYDAEGRTLVLAGPDGRGGATLPVGSISALTLALARVAEVMDRDQDALVLKAQPAGPACHTGARSCFFRKLTGNKLESRQDMP